MLVSPGEYSHTTPAVGGAETKSRSVVGGTTAAAGHCSVAGQLDGDVLVSFFSVGEFAALAGGVELSGGDTGGDDGGAGKDDEAGGSDGAD